MILTQYFEPEIGAPQVRLGALARELCDRGHEVEVVTGMPNHPFGRIREDYGGRLSLLENVNGVRVHRVWLYAATGSGLKRLLNYVSFCITSVLGLIRCRRPDVIFVESPPPLLMVPARIFGLVWRRKVVMNVADLWPDAAKALGLLDDGLVLRLLLLFERWSYHTADRICSVTDGVRAVLENDKHVAPSKIVDLPNGADTMMFAPRPPDPHVFAPFGIDAIHVFIYAGTIGYAHGVETAVDAMVLVGKSHPDAHLLIVGGGSEWETVQRRIDGLGTANVTLARPVPLSDIAGLLNASRAAVSLIRDSALLEGVRPSKLFPAMASGVPIVYSGAGEGAEIVSSAGAGIVVPPEDAPALAAAFCRLIDDPEAAAEMGAAGRRVAEERFSWGPIVDNWLSQLGIADVSGDSGSSSGDNLGAAPG